MPKVWNRSNEEVYALAQELRDRHPFGTSGLGPWLRANLDLMIALRAGRWSPDDSSVVMTRGRWHYGDILRAMEEANPPFSIDKLTTAILSNRVKAIEKEQAVAALSPKFDELKRAILEALDERGLIGGGGGVASRPASSPGPPLEYQERPVELPPANRSVKLPRESEVEPEKLNALSQLYNRPKPRKLLDITPITLTHEQRQGPSMAKK